MVFGFSDRVSANQLPYRPNVWAYKNVKLSAPFLKENMKCNRKYDYNFYLRMKQHAITTNLMIFSYLECLLLLKNVNPRPHGKNLQPVVMLNTVALPTLFMEHPCYTIFRLNNIV